MKSDYTLNDYDAYMRVLKRSIKQTEEDIEDLADFKKIASLSFDDWVKWQNKELSIDDIPELPKKIRGRLLEYWKNNAEGDYTKTPISVQKYITILEEVNVLRAEGSSRVLNWVTVIEDDIETYPREGVTVLVSDGDNYDVAWYLMSGEYQWRKTDLLGDEANEFKAFNILKWAYVE